MALIGILAGVWAAPLRAQSSAPAQPPPKDDAVRQHATALLRTGARYLIAAQEADGGWSSASGPGITALCVRALAQTPGIGPQHESVRRGTELVLKSQREDGGIYSAEGLLKNYESSIALSMLAALHDQRHQAAVEKLQQFLIKLQWDESENIGPDNAWYGGAGYGQGRRPDLSNTQMMLEALHDSGLPKDHPTYRRALQFIERCQMRGESNDQPFARGSTQGGFIYSPVHGGESKAETVDVDGRQELRCYGTMTYAGFKSLLYAGLTRDDARVRAALEWIRANWTLESNPNMPQTRSREGLYYYYHVFARALAAWGEPVLADAQGRKHDWRRELIEQLARQQRGDGSWSNEADRWMEGHPALATAYALLALGATLDEN